jgi:methyl-accepting chemotaxis protein/cytochrome b561
MTYPRPLRLLHWTVAALVTCQLALAVVLTQLRSLSYGQFVLSLHRQLGLVILMLVLARLVMSRWHKVPSHGSSGLPSWQVRTAALVHGGFAMLLLAQPVIGVLLAWARGDSVGLLGLVQVAAPMELSDSLREQLMTVHAVTAVVLFSLCVVHVGAVVFNRLFRHVSVIDRMLPPVSSHKLVNRVSVGAQLSWAFGLVIGTALIVVLNAVATYRDLNRATTAFQSEDIAVADQLRAAQVSWKDFYATAATANQNGSPAADVTSHLKDAADTAKSSLEEAWTHAPTGDIKTGLRAAMEQLTAAATAGAVNLAAVKAIDARLQELVDSQSLVTLQRRTDTDDLAARGHDLIVVTILPMVIGALVVGLLLARSFSDSLGRMTVLIKGIEEDRRTAAVEVQGRGQFAGLIRDILAMRVAVESRANAAASRQSELEAERARLAQEQLQREAENERQQSSIRRAQREQLAAEFELQVAGIIATVSEAAKAFTSTAGKLAASAATSAQRSREASSVAERTSGAASEVAMGTGELSERAHSVRENAQRSKSRASLAVQEAAQVRAQTEHLIAAVRQISSITDLIAAVARQTNLLAINARVEAARAGEFGRGFSVVADEVKALAQRTREATNGIEKNIQQIDAAAGRSSESLQRLLEVISGVDQAASEIFEVIDAQVASTGQLTERISVISTSTRSVATDIRDAQETARATEQMSTDMVQTAAVIEEQAEHLRDQVGQFVLELRSAGVSPSAALPAGQGGPREQKSEQWRAVAS